MSNFFEILRKKYLINLDSSQRAAVEHLKGPALVLAGPGSGKTTVIIARTFYLISKANNNPDEILTLTFNKAAQVEMNNRFSKVFGDQTFKKVKFVTFHSFCFSVLREYERRQGYRFRLIEGKTGEDLPYKTVILKNIYEKINGTIANEEELETLSNEIGYVKNKMVTDFSGLNLRTREFGKIYMAYEKLKRENSFIDFDDMLTYCLDILNKYPEILISYKNRYKYFQVDEGQDLSKIQFEILKKLCSSEESNLFIVADDDQSIYGFRGAEPKYILELGKYYKGLGIYKLENNYRSTRNIVELSSKLIKKNKLRYHKSHKTGNPVFNDPVIVNVEDEIEQLKFIEETVKYHLRENHTVAILYRNNISSVPIAEMLDRKGIPFVLRQNRIHFFRHWAVQDIIGFLNFALNPYDYESFKRIYYKINLYISKNMMENAFKNQYRLPVIESLIKENVLQAYQINELKNSIRKFKNLSGMRPLKALKYIEDEFKYFGNIKGLCEYTGVSVDYIYSLFGVLKTLSASCRSIPEFLVKLDALSKIFENKEGDFGSGQNPVSLITLHSSKGLEYDAVLMVDLTNSQIPGESTAVKSVNHDQNLIEEERRLFYVGMTRAKKWLYMICPQYVNEMKEFRSTFVNEAASILGEKLLGSVIEGRVIVHKKYGEGIISSVDHKYGTTVIEVDFGGKTRSLDLVLCLENRIIRFC